MSALLLQFRNDVSHLTLVCLYADSHLNKIAVKLQVLTQSFKLNIEDQAITEYVSDLARLLFLLRQV